MELWSALCVILIGAVVAVGFLVCISPTIRKDVFRYFDLFSNIRKSDDNQSTP